MAEEVLYEVEQGGDPDPLGLRKKLKQVKTDRPDPLGLRPKLAQQEPAPQRAEPQPTFKPMTDWLNIPQQGYQPIVPENATPIDDHTIKTNQASQRVQNHLGDIDNSIHNLIYEKKKDVQGRLVSQQLGLNPSESGPINAQAQEIESRLRKDVPVDPGEVEQFKVGMNENPVMLRQGLAQKAKDLVKENPIEANKLKGDIYRLDRQANPEKEDNISKNIDKIDSGEYDYDIVNGRLIKPLGFFGSIAHAFREKGNAYDDYDVYQSGDEKKIMDRIKQRLNDDPDKATPTPIGAMGEAGAILGGQPLKPLIGGAIAGVLTEGLGTPAAAAAISAPEMYKLTFGSALPHNYAALKKQNPDLPDSEVLQKAIDLTDKQANTDALSGAAMGAIGARAALKPAASALLQKSVKSALKQIGETVAIEGIGGGAVGAGGQLVKNLMAQKSGIPVDESEGMAQQLVGGAFMTLGMAVAGKAGALLKPSTYNKLLHGLSKLPEEVIVNEFARAQEVGALTPEEAQKVQTDLAEQKKVDASIRGDVPESDRIKVQEKIKQRDAKEKELETAHKAYHPEIKEEIKRLDEDILNLSKGSERGELQKLVDKEHEAGKIEGFVTEALRDATEKELQGYFKDIAEQAHDPNSEATTIATFGEEIVNKAKELYPKEEPKQSGITVIQPGEIRHPETITVSPREQPTDIQSTDKVSVIMPKNKDNAIPIGKSEATVMGEESVPSPEMGQRVPEPGEATNAQEGQQSAQEESAPSGQEGVGVPREIGITHRQMDALAEELGLPTYEKSPEKVAEWDQQAAKQLQKPEALNDLFNKLRNGILPDHVETRMMLQYMGDIAAKVEKDPYNRALQDQLLRTKDLFNIAGRLQGKGLAARKGSIPAEETLSDFLIRDRETNKAPLTDEQITVSKKEFEDIKAAKDAFEAKMAADKEKATKAKAEKIVQEEAKAAKKSTKKDYTSEREKIFTDIKEKLRKARGDTSVVIVPYAKELIAIAPDVMKLVKNYVEQGVSELPELVRYVREALIDDIPHITENDVHNIIAGEYNQKKPTRSQLAQQVYDLRKEASLINQLEDLQNGQIPASKNKQRQRNQKIEALRTQIKEIRDEMGLNEKTEAEKLSALKARYKSQISELEKKIAAGDYGPDVKPQPITLDKEAIDLKDRMIKVKLDREARLAKQEYENRTAGQKAKDTAADALDAVRTLQTNPDLSFFGRQGIKFLVTHPIKGPKVFWESAKQALSQKRYDRWLFDMHNSPAWKLIEESGLAVLDPNTLHASQREEQWRSQLIHKIPGAGQVAKASERAFTSAANMARVDWFMEGVDILRKQGKTWENSPEEYKGWASAVNNMTGRGGLGKLEPVVGQLAIPFWSPRLIAANVNLFLNPAYYVKMPKTARIMLIKNMAQYVVTGGAFLGLANMLGADTEVDPRSSDFGKIKVGNTRYDIWGGASQYIRVFAQLGLEARKSGGNVSEIKPRQMITTGTNLVRTKLSPIWGFMIDAKLGENVVGEKVEWKDAYKLMIPMLWNDIQDAKKDSGPEAGAVAGLLSFLGIGAQTYGSDKSGSGTSSSKPGKPGKPSKPSKPSK